MLQRRGWPEADGKFVARINGYAGAYRGLQSDQRYLGIFFGGGGHGSDGGLLLAVQEDSGSAILNRGLDCPGCLAGSVGHDFFKPDLRGENSLERHLAVKRDCALAFIHADCTAYH